MPKLPRDLSAYSSNELIADFVDISLEQEQALFEGNTKRYNRLYDEMVEVRSELKRRPGDHRRQLVELLQHENSKVRLNAAQSTLVFEPHIARAVVEELANARLGSVSLDAGMCLWTLDQGIFKPS